MVDEGNLVPTTTRVATERVWRAPERDWWETRRRKEEVSLSFVFSTFNEAIIGCDAFFNYFTKIFFDILIDNKGLKL